MFSAVRPAPPSSLSSRVRPRANTLTSSSAPPPASHQPSVNLSPSLSRSYRQPVGTGSIRRQQQQLGHSRSRSTSDAVATAAVGGAPGGSRRAVFCDLVVDDLSIDENGQLSSPNSPTGDFLRALGERVTFEEEESTTQGRSRPSTPAKPGKVDYDRVRQSLHEMWTTEESYLRKISSLQKNYAVPLRNFAKSRSTAIIPSFEANHLFGNIDQLVPLATAFEADLRNIADRARRDTTSLPSGFGEVILYHVERMKKPYKTWLASVTAVDAIRRELDRSNSSFREYIERTQVVSREMAQTSGGFKEFLAEPHQRIARYRLMLDPIVASLPPDDPEAIQVRAAIDLVSAICSMETDQSTKRAAVFWALNEAIDGLPDSLVGTERNFIDAIDVDEVVEVSDPRSTSETLRCTLWLFSDRLLITKRPRGDRMGIALAGLDSPDRLLQLYQTAHLTSSQATLLGSPKRLRKGIFAYRGLFKLAEVVAVDLGSSESDHELGLLLDDPPLDQTARWNGRPARRYVVAETGAAENRAREKERFLAKFGETMLQQRLQDGALAAYRSRLLRVTGGSASGNVLWSVWERGTYETLRGTQKSKLAVHLTNNERVPPLKTSGLRPNILVRATLLGGTDLCCFDVTTKDWGGNTAENIKLDQIPLAVFELGLSAGLFSFPNLRPLSELSRSRAHSGLLSVVNLFSSGGPLKRGNSTTSRGSSSGTTTIDTPRFSDAAAPRFAASASPQASLSQSWRGPISKKSAPDLHSAQSAHSDDLEGEFSAYDGLADVGGGLPVQPLSLRSRARPRRSISLPPPTFAGADLAAASMENAPNIAEAVEDAHEGAEAPMDAVADSPLRYQGEPELPDTSPMVYREPERTTSRRRMIGPRDMRPSGSARDLADSSPAQLPFARDHSPTPGRPSHSTSHALTATEDSPMGSDVGDASFDPHASAASAAAKRPRPLVEASPRPTPAKKTASLAGSSPIAGPRAPAPPQPDLSSSIRKSSAGSLLQRRVPSGSSVLNRARPISRRVASGASTVRGPPTPPRDAETPDVFSPPASAPRLYAQEDVTMADLEQEPFHLLRKHVDDMRLRLSREIVDDKENDRIISPTALTRSPQTRNVFGKTVFGSEPPYSSPQARHSSVSKGFTPLSEGRTRTRHIDKHVLTEWTRKLAELVDDAETAAATAATKPHSPTDGGGSALEAAVLEQERDLLTAEVIGLKGEAEKLAGELSECRTALEAAQTDRTNLHQAYADICAEANELVQEFNIALEGVTLAAQAEPTATGEYVALTSQLRDATSARFHAEHELRVYRRSVQAELEEKARLEELCRRHGLLA